MNRQIHLAIERVLTELGLPIGQYIVERPRSESYGDYSSNIAIALAKQVGEQPVDLANKIATKLQNDIEINRLIGEIRVVKPGFINFFVNHNWLIKELDNATSAKYGSNEIGRGKRVIVEYSSPNIAKPFTVGHLRSTIIGDAIANLLEYSGWQVMRDNHLGDWGTQFGKQIVAIKEWGDIEKIKNSSNPVKELVELYVKFHEEAERDAQLEDKAREWFRKLEQGDAEARSIWELCVELSMREFARIYALLGVRFSAEFEGGRGLGESFFEDKMDAVVAELKEKGLLKPGKDGAQLVFFDGDKLPPAMILKKDGGTLYHTRDLATDRYRKDQYNPDLIVNEVGSEQELYFRQLYEIERLLEWFDQHQRVHVKHGLYRFRDQKMSTRKGNTVWLEEVLDEAIERAAKLQKEGGDGQEKLAKIVGIGALKWNDLRGEARRDIVFDWEQIMNMQGDSGPYMQYTYARAQSVLRKASLKPVGHVDDVQLNDEELSLARHIVRLPEVVEEAARNMAPHTLANYLYQLASSFNTFYNKHKVVGSQEEGIRLSLTEATSNVLQIGLEILGIDAPEEM